VVSHTAFRLPYVLATWLADVAIAETIGVMKELMRFSALDGQPNHYNARITHSQLIPSLYNLKKNER
jgi:hypothetical protein